ncbi:glycoside hydrolase family 3 protein [Novipirellula artificiosorum]|uniref:beta-glucosidase n=1 Tax=Novipirellula artificiosorum TaxID=2528016 RepID=A0A5C6D960_9BACT|nr:glycoside hydrolase family 3 N-terminal domain-containing protein [Novipirellula artificiosorum]TWU33683.1 Periplasmic beta-glucosidase precursor [Novipirellula artificiosorum]
MSNHLTLRQFAAAIFFVSIPLASIATADEGQELFLAFDVQAKKVVSEMTLEEKVGQMCQPDQAFLKEPSDIGKYFLGSLLSGGGSGPKDKAKYTLEGWTDMVDGYQREALKTRLGIPLLYGVDAVHGHNNIPGAVIFPHNIGLGCTRNSQLVEQISRVTAKEVRATGINWDFAPCVAVPRDERWGRTYEGFSESPDVVKVLGAASTRGLQGGSLSDPLSVAACAKHFIGDGGTAYRSAERDGKLGMDQGDTRCDEETLRRVHLPGYLTTLREGVATVMPSYSSWNGQKCTGRKDLLTDLLKTELGFNGFLISDYNAIDQLAPDPKNPDYKTCIELAINAGIDMVMLTDKYQDYCRMLPELVREGRVPLSRIDDAVIRILRVKYAMGLMDKDRSPLADRTLHDTVGSDPHRAVARQAVRESLVLLKNDHGILPLSKSTQRIHVAGVGGNDLGMQCGGWTTDWQGSMGNHVPGGTTLLDAIKQTVSQDTHVTYSADGSGAENADVGVVVIGEKPYAEFMGDSIELSLDAEQLQTLANMKEANIPLVVVLLSGRPVILGDMLDSSTALIAAWLPGSEGQGVADVLFGDFKPTGKLSFSWPKSVAQLPLNLDDDDAAPLYPFGFGLTYE